MQRRQLIQTLAAAPLMTALPFACAETIPRLKKSDDEWKVLLPRNRYLVLFEEATEPSFTSPLNDEKRDGTYVCAACFQPLFTSDQKYDSGTGWPSFTHHLKGVMGTKTDYKLIVPRTEYHCARCGGHQGHVFSDGPRPRGERWCNNGLALLFYPDGTPLPELRT
ncbi:MAG: peptide-methionine (R)-S-oxide reductase MsrB [Pseudomonadota bacterium]